MPADHEAWQPTLDQMVADAHRQHEPHQVPCVMLPSEERMLDRNDAISGSYAAMYLRRPELFKWCGMAAFASHHVRKLIGVLEAARAGAPLAKAISRVTNESELETIRGINNAIHEDIYWAHLVYDGTEAGLTRLRTMLAGTEKQAMLQGFETIEHGRKALAAGDAGAIDLIWEGNTQLLWHEQEQVVQPRLARLSGSFARIFSVGSSLNYEPCGTIECLKYCSSFYMYMVARHPGLLLRSGSLPRLNKLDQRWTWITRVLLPNYRAMEIESAIPKLEAIAREGWAAIDRQP